MIVTGSAQSRKIRVAGACLWTRLGSAAIVAGVMALCAGAVAAEKAVSAKAEQPETAAGAAIKATEAIKAKPQKSLYDMSMSELRDYQSFFYAAGMRDPFTYRKGKDPETVTTTTVSSGGTGKIEVKDNAPTIAEQRRFLRESIMRAELLMLAHDYKNVIAISDDAQKKIVDDWKITRLVPDLQQMWNDLKYDYGMTAKRLQHAEDTRREFAGLNLQVLGIRWTPQGAAALVSGRLYEAGEVIEDLKIEERVHVAEIEERAVVFMYKGQRFRVGVGAERETGDAQ